MQDGNPAANPQNPAHKRAFIIRPAPAYHEAAGVESHHPCCAPVVILTPGLPYETWFEGWQRSWREKAKLDFLADFLEFWSHESWELDGGFVTRLREADEPVAAFDQWWTLEEHREVREIDAAWRPS